VALDTVISDWNESYEESSSAGMLKLINFLIRCCGCKHFITAEEFEDEDNNVQILENILERYQAVTTITMIDR
jgi:cohesin complex subunit SA-1/2